MDRPPLIETEVLLPGSETTRAAAAKSNPGGEGPAPGPTDVFHPAASALLILVDNFWMIPEFAIVTLWFTIPLSFLSVFLTTYLVQRRWAHNRRRVAVAKALFFGVVAGLPFSVTGTPVGFALLAWAGVKRLRR